MRVTPASIDPEYVWLKEGTASVVEFDGSGMRDIGPGQTTASKDRKMTRLRNKSILRSNDRTFHLGVLGASLQCLGLLWLLSAIGFSIPWYSIFPLTIMTVGGVFIVRAIIRDRTEMEAFNDGRNNSRY